MALGDRLIVAGVAADSPVAHHFDRHAVLDPEAYARRRGGSKPAEDDDVHAADVRLHVLLRLCRTCTILVDRECGGNRSTAHHQQTYARPNAGSGPAAAKSSR